MTTEKTHIIDQAVARLDPLDRPSVERIADFGNGLWYLKRQIVGAQTHKSLLAHTRPLKYASLFDLGGANVTFVKETKSKTPDLQVIVEGLQFFVEVRKFGMDEGPGASAPVSKIVDGIDEKRSQLPDSAIGFVAIDNFDIRLEPGLGHDFIEEALSEVERRTNSNPPGWRKPSGAIISAASHFGPWPPPAFVWINHQAECRAPEHLVRWLLDVLPGAGLFRPTRPEDRYETATKHN